LVGDDEVLDAARGCLLAVGVRRTTLTDVARAAGLSRPTLYRRWPDLRRLVADVTAREWRDTVRSALDGSESAGVDGSLDGLVERLVHCVRALRELPLLRKIIEVDPELLLPYVFERRGTSQQQVLDLVERDVADGIAHGWVRPGDPAAIARSLLLTAQSFVLSGATMARVPGDPGLDVLDTEFRVMITRYLRPDRALAA
jgi:AcrR family transcriptional regulator